MSDQSKFTSEIREEFRLSVHFEGQDYAIKVIGSIVNGDHSYAIHFTESEPEALELERIEDPLIDDNLTWKPKYNTKKPQAFIDAIGDAIDRYEL